jgi:hypothetical protein
VIDGRRCIIDRVGYTAIKFGLDARSGFDESTIGDIDRDGAADSTVKLIGAPSTVFGSNHGCERDLGDVSGSIVALVEPDSPTGNRNVLTYHSAGCGGYAGTLQVWTLDGQHVNPPQTVATCDCPDLTRPDPSRHAMCPAVQPH